jgi:hypothetical protein
MRISMTRISTPALLLAALAIAGPAAAATTKAAPPKLTIETLPAAVQKTVRVQTEGAIINDISKEKSESGKWVYEIETKVNGLGHDFIVDMDGTMLTSERQMAVESLPPAVKATLLKAAGKSPILIVESVTKGGKLECYEAQVGSAKAPKEIKVGPDGALMK